MTHTVVGLFDSKEEARDAMKALTSAGFIKEDVDVSNRKFADAVPSTTDDSGDLTDDVSNFFSNLFSDDENSRQRYTYAAREADAILTVQTDSKDRAEKAADIMDDNGAINVNDRAAQYQQRFAAGGKTAQGKNLKGDNEVTIPVVEENLEVGKRAVETGGVRIRSRVIEKPIEETIRLREEHVVVNRRPVDRAVSNADFDNVREGEFEITEHAEKAVVNKQARVVEEISVGKEVDVHEETVSDTVRSTDVDVEEINTETRRAANK